MAMTLLPLHCDQCQLFIYGTHMSHISNIIKHSQSNKFIHKTTWCKVGAKLLCFCHEVINLWQLESPRVQPVWSTMPPSGGWRQLYIQERSWTLKHLIKIKKQYSNFNCQHVSTYGLVSWQIWHSHPAPSSRVLQTSASTCLHLAHLQTFSSMPGRGRFGRHWHPPQGRLRIVLCPLWPMLCICTATSDLLQGNLSKALRL